MDMCEDCNVREITHVGCGQCTECYSAMLAEMNARVERGECYWCGADCICEEMAPKCKDCRQTITGCSWSGRCLDCHERYACVYVAAPIPPQELDAAGGYVYA